MPWFGRRRKEGGDGGGGVEAATMPSRSEQTNAAGQSADGAADASELESPAVPSVDGQLDASVRVIDTNPAHTNRKRDR